LKLTGNREKYVSINDIEEYPQYLYVENEDEYTSLKVMTADDADIGNEKWDKSIFEHLAIFLEKLLNFISELFSQIMSDVNKS